jgi:hypothetical protein
MNESAKRSYREGSKGLQRDIGRKEFGVGGRR